jgi:hypothetical protein
MLTEVRNLTTTCENLYVKFTSVTYIRCQVTYITCQVTYTVKNTCSQKAKDLVNCQQISLSDYIFIVSFPYLSRDYLSCNDKKFKCWHCVTYFPKNSFIELHKQTKIHVCCFYGQLVVYKLVSKETFNKNLFPFITFSYADILCVLDRYRHQNFKSIYFFQGSSKYFVYFLTKSLLS